MHGHRAEPISSFQSRRSGSSKTHRGGVATGNRGLASAAASRDTTERAHAGLVAKKMSKQNGGSKMGHFSYALRILAGLFMAVSLLVAGLSLGDVSTQSSAANAFMFSLAVFIFSAILWVLTEILEQLELARRPIAEKVDEKQINHAAAIASEPRSTSSQPA